MLMLKLAARFACLVSIAASFASAQNVPTSWSPCSDWVVQPNSAAGTTQGNPAPDSLGNLVWNYEYTTTGGVLGSSNPWYDEPATKLVWDTSWYGQPKGAWVVSNDFGTNFRWTGPTHIYGTSFQYAPILRFQNTTGQAINLDIRGRLGVWWGGAGGVAGQVAVDVVIAHQLAGGGPSTLLFSGTHNKPTPNSPVSEMLLLPVDLSAVSLAPGDSIVIAHRAQNTVSESRWIVFRLADLWLVRPGALIGTPYCFGDGSATPCPCGNSGGPRQGCANSTGQGVEVFAHGSQSIVADDLMFTCEGMGGSQPALLFAGTTQPGLASGLVFGDGLRCTGGQVQRLGITQSDDCGQASWGGGLLAGSNLLAGDTRFYQVWYRDPDNGPCGSSFNTSNAISLTFTQ